MGFMESTCRRPENTAAPSSWQHNWVAATFGAPSSQSLKKHCHHLNPTQCLPRFSQIAHPWAQVHIPKLKHIRWRKVIPLAHGTIVDTLTGRMMNKVKFFLICQEHFNLRLTAVGPALLLKGLWKNMRNKNVSEWSR
jgi:hypothetical protein